MCIANKPSLVYSCFMKIFILLTLFSTTLLASDFEFDKSKGKALPKYVAEIKLFRGKVWKVTDGKQKEVQQGTRFFNNDTIITEDKSVVKLQVVDDTILNLGPKSELNFAEFKFTDKTDRHIVYNFIKGQLSGNVKNKANEGDLTVKTKSAIMGIRGTQILVNHQNINNLEVSEFALLSGSAQVTDDKKQKHDLSTAKKLTLVQDTKDQKSAVESKVLNEEELKYLNAIDKNDDKQFKPFMPYFEPSKVRKDSTLFSLVSGEKTNSTQDDNEDKDDKKDDNPKGWKHNLEKLNEQLKEDRKKSL
jgi:hypothetical protein